MAWLDDHPPARSQFRRGRRARLRPVIVGHTGENAPVLADPDRSAGNVAGFIRRRSDPGSYHLLVDSREVIDLVDLDNEAYHDGTGSNPWSMGISAALRTTDWARLPSERRHRVLRNLAVAAARCNVHSMARGAGRVEPRRITRAQSEAGVSGFIAHGDRDPGRRTDWGTTSAAPFPWAEFLDHYRRAIAHPTAAPPPPGGFTMSELAAIHHKLDRVLASQTRMEPQLRRVDDAIGHSGRGVRQVIAETDDRTKRIVSAVRDDRGGILQRFLAWAGQQS